MLFSFKNNKGFCHAFIQSFNLNSFFGDPERKKLMIKNDGNSDKDVNNPNQNEN